MANEVSLLLTYIRREMRIILTSELALRRVLFSKVLSIGGIHQGVRVCYILGVRVCYIVRKGVSPLKVFGLFLELTPTLG